MSKIDLSLMCKEGDCKDPLWCIQRHLCKSHNEASGQSETAAEGPVVQSELRAAGWRCDKVGGGDE